MKEKKKNCNYKSTAALTQYTLSQFCWCQYFIAVVSFFPPKPQTLTLPLIICYFVPLQPLMPRHNFLSLSSLLSVAILLKSIPLLLKPQVLSGSIQIMSLRLCICFQSCAINPAGFLYQSPPFFSLCVPFFDHVSPICTRCTVYLNIITLYVSVKLKQCKISSYVCYLPWVGKKTPKNWSSFACTQQHVCQCPACKMKLLPQRTSGKKWNENEIAKIIC